MMFDDNPSPTLGWAVRSGRGTASLRDVARRSKISAGQISRIETGAVQQPAVETLTALAPAINRHPAVLLILAGHLSGEAARAELRRLVEHAAESIVEEYDRGYLDELRTKIDQADDDDKLGWATVQVATLPFADVDFPETLRVAMTTDAPDVDLLHDLIDLWPGITAERRWRLVELARDLHRASIHTSHHTD